MSHFEPFVNPRFAAYGSHLREVLPFAQNRQGQYGANQGLQNGFVVFNRTVATGFGSVYRPKVHVMLFGGTNELWVAEC